MVKQTFLNLSKEKQERILASARREFSRASLNEASVANIIKDADIPRGSFYQYFNDLEDMYYYILESHSKDIKQHLLNSLVDYNGDIIKAFVSMYQYILDKTSAAENELYFKNIFLNMDYKLEKMFLPNLEDSLNEVIQLINIESLNINSRLQLIYVLDIMEAIMIHNLIQSYQRSVSKDKNMEIFIKEILLVREGIYKKVED